MAKLMTNTQLVKDIMEHSKYGALAQVFVMDALFKFSDMVADSHVKDYGDNPMVNPEAWIGVAKEIRTKLREKE